LKSGGVKTSPCLEPFLKGNLSDNFIVFVSPNFNVPVFRIMSHYIHLRVSAHVGAVYGVLYLTVRFSAQQLAVSICPIIFVKCGNAFLISNFRRVLNVVCFLLGNSTPIRLWRWKRQSVPKRRHIKFRRRGITH